MLQSFLSSANNLKIIKNAEGRKFIAHLFNLDPTISQVSINQFLYLLIAISLFNVQMLHQAIKKTLPLMNATDCENVGEIYFRAWRHPSERTRAEVESSIQDLMYHAVVANRRPLGALEVGNNKVVYNSVQS